MRIVLPPLYAIIDVDKHPDPVEFAKRLFLAGVQLLQLRNKSLAAQDLLDIAGRISAERKGLPGGSIRPTLLINDDVHICIECGADGVHLGQDDRPVENARRLLGEQAIIGLSTHNEGEMRLAPYELLSYVAAGPVFESQTKSGHAPPLGIDGLRRLVDLSALPVVAIGGITAENAQMVYQAGASSIAAIGALSESPSLNRTIASFSPVRPLSFRERR